MQCTGYCLYFDISKLRIYDYLVFAGLAISLTAP